MCQKPKIPKAPKVTTVGTAPDPEQTALEVGRSGSVQSSRTARDTIEQFDLKFPPSFQIPT